jgi:hypothetical protein
VEKRGIPDETMIKARVDIDRAMSELTQFENSRVATIDIDRCAFTPPLRLIASAMSAFLGTYLAAYVLCKAFGVNSTHHNVPHTRAAHIAFLVWAVVSLLLLLLTAATHDVLVASSIWQHSIVYAWWACCLSTLAFSIAYPVLALPGPRLLAGQRISNSDADSLMPDARRKYKQAYLSLFRRYLGVQMGLTLISVSVWVVIFRIAGSLYPWQIELLSTGLSYEEAETVLRALSIAG